MDKFTKDALEAHNALRAKHQAPPLTWSAELQNGAQAWADDLAKKGKLAHANPDSRKGHGENVFMCSGKEVSGSDVTDTWYSEVKKYNFGKGGWQSGCGHFTQVVWKDSKEFGFARAKATNGAIFVVGRYKPAGNNMSQFATCVFPNKG